MPRYLRAIAALYIRLTLRPYEVYTLLEPLQRWHATHRKTTGGY